MSWFYFDGLQLDPADPACSKFVPRSSSAGCFYNCSESSKYRLISYTIILRRRRRSCCCCYSIITNFFTSSLRNTPFKLSVAGDVVDKDPSVLNVHVVPHTHDDVGWLKTVDQYYYGTNNTIQHANVNSIITNVVNELKSHSERTFTYVEMKFFHMWWIDQPLHVQNDVIDLVRSGQLNFVNGGWCMHDEATTHFMGMIDQTTLGHTFVSQSYISIVYSHEHVACIMLLLSAHSLFWLGFTVEEYL